MLEKYLFIILSLMYTISSVCLFVICCDVLCILSGVLCPFFCHITCNVLKGPGHTPPHAASLAELCGCHWQGVNIQGCLEKKKSLKKGVQELYINSEVLGTYTTPFK